MTRSLPGRLVGRRGAWVTLLLAVLVAAGLVGGLRGAEVPNDHLGVPTTSESAQVDRLLVQLPDHDVQSLVLVVTRSDGAALTEADLGGLGRLGAGLPVADGREVAGPIPSEDGEAALLQVPVRLPSDDTDATRAAVDEVRAAVADDLPAGLSAQTTGGPAFGADLAASFDGADVRLLLTTIGVVGVLLLLTYRSPVLWLVPVVVVGVADQVAAVLTAYVGERLGLTFDAGIISVLVFGAGANYALLLISRYREELHVEADHRAALARAWRGTLPAILASNVSVVLALLTLTLATIPSTRGIGVAAAVGLLVALAAVLLVLPAALAVVGRRVFWPFVPRPDRGTAEPAGRRDLWGSVARTVVRRPWQILAAGVVVLGVMASGLVGTHVGLTQTDRFRVAAESGQALDTLAEHFPAGSAQPMVVLARADRAEQVASAVGAVDGVELVRPGATGTVDARAAADAADLSLDDLGAAAGPTGEVATLSVTGSAAPGSPAERELVGAVREAAHGIPDAAALVGGGPATQVDLADGTDADLRLVAPLVLGVVALVLAVLLRSLVAPVVLLAVNVASTLATIGAGAWLSRRIFDLPALDSPVPLLAFLFLVALGIDYTIFLVHRIRSEVPGHGTREATVRGVRTTGVVITSAGIVLAGVFAALGVLPLVTLGQLGLIVGLGVVVDTLLVRTLLVPAVITLLGDRVWWPGPGRRS